MAKQIKVEVQPDGTFGWRELAHLVSATRVTQALKREMTVAHRQVGHAFVARATDVITRDKPFKSNSRLTILMKGSSTPLADEGTLVGGLTFRVASWKRLQMGVNSKRLASGRFLADVLHNGATIRVTTRMRAAVLAMLRARIGDAAFRSFAQRFLGGPAKAFWIIPPRPFLTTVWKDRQWLEFANQAYGRAMARSFLEG